MFGKTRGGKWEFRFQGAGPGRPFMHTARTQRPAARRPGQVNRGFYPRRVWPVFSLDTRRSRG